MSEEVNFVPNQPTIRNSTKSRTDSATRDPSLLKKTIFDDVMIRYAQKLLKFRNF